MIKKLIINADDFGMTEGTTLGILSAHQNGILTSTTCMMNMPYAEYALKQAEHFPKLGVGVHLNMTIGKPLLSQATSFVDKNGFFIRPKNYPQGQIHVDEDELYQEWKAQIEKYISLTGKKPTHLDSHHHVHLLPWHTHIIKKLSQEYDVPIRQREQIIDTYQYVPCHDRMYDDDIRIDYLKDIFSSYDETLELMCHPALIDQRLYDISSYSLSRMKELQLLQSPEFLQLIQDNHIELISFQNIQKI